jgi:Fe2+ or Zn2+ uptake regulation protein
MNACPAQHTSLIQQLSSQRIRLTAQRRAILEIIQEAHGHLDAATLLDLARKRDAKVDRATIYRTLDVLKKLHLVDELDLMHLNGGGHFYEAKPAVDHMHLACFHCGRIEEFISPLFEKLKREISRRKGFDIAEVRLEVGGRCEKCRRTGVSRTERAPH